MLERLEGWVGYGLVSALILGFIGCGGGAKTSATVDTTASDVGEEEGDYDTKTFAPLPAVTREANVPMLLGPDGVENLRCFKAVEGLTPVEGDVRLEVFMEEHAALASKAAKKWFVNTLAPGTVTSAMTETWKVKVADPVALEVDAGKLRFVDDPECIQQDTGWLPSDVRAVTAVYGARTFHVEASPPVKAVVKEDIVSGVENENMVIESDDLRDYEPLLDHNGEPKLDAKKRALFKAPNGTLVPENEVPSPEERTMKKWTLKTETPLFFAFREMPDDAFNWESDKKLCDVYLVWDDPEPRAPDCQEFNESKFAAKKLDSHRIELTIQTGEQKQAVEIGYRDVKMVQVNDRIVLWISPVEAGEGLGVKVRLNSVVLDPRAGRGY